MKKNYFFNNIISISILLFFTKWFFFFNTDLDIDIITKLIFKVADWQYFISISNFSDLNFNPSYGYNFTDLKFIPYPIYSIIYHSLFLKFFDIYGFIIIELFIIFTFFYIFFYFFKNIGLEKTETIFLILLIFCLPNIVDYLQLDNIKYFGAIKELYNLRIPRPSISHLYLFLIFLLLVTCKRKIQFKYTQLAWVGIIFALMFGSFYYNLAISGITFVIYYFYITYQSNQKFYKYVKDFIVVSVFFILFSIPMIWILLNSESDYGIRLGLVELDFSKKKILIDHFIEQIFSVKFIAIFIFITFLFLILKIKKSYKPEGVNLLYFIFLSSFLGPLVFILVSPTISEPYHFANMIIAITFFIILVYLFLILLLFTKNLSYRGNFFNIATILILFFYGYSNYLLTKKDHYTLEQSNLNQLIIEIKKIDIDKNSTILTFDARAQVHLILNNYKNLLNIIGANTSMNDEMLEDNIINIFKILNLSKVDFNNFIKNERRGWRFINPYVGQYFYMKYQANNLTTYKNSNDFSSEELKYISKSSPSHSQQLIIPIFEIERLTNKFINFSKKKDLNPDLIIININDIITQNLVIDDKFYCSRNVNKNYMIYFYKKDNSNC